MSITEAARWFRRDRSTIYAWIRSGDLPATKVNGRNYVARADAERLARTKGGEAEDMTCKSCGRGMSQHSGHPLRCPDEGEK